MSDHGGFPGCGDTAAANLGVVALATLVIGIAACGGDDGDETTAQCSGERGPRGRAPRTSTGSSCATDEEPGFRPGAAPGAMPSIARDHHGRQGVRGGDAACRRPTRGDCAARGSSRSPSSRSAARGDGRDHERRPVRDRGRRPAATWRTSCARTSSARLAPSRTSDSSPSRAFPARAAGPRPTPHVGNLWWVQGRCMLVLGNQGPGPFAGPLSTGARAIYERTGGHCP